MVRSGDFDALVVEAENAPIDGWDFSWLDGRATEERPSWQFARLLARRLQNADASLDIQTGGGEVLAEVLDAAGARPDVVAATESWPPNARLARARLARFGVDVAEVPDDADLPFGAGTFDLVTSRHPTSIRWDEVARVLRPGGHYVAQHVGPGSNRELTDALMGPQPVSMTRSAARAVADAQRAGLEPVDLRDARLRVEFRDIGAIVYFLRKVIWTVPGFTVDEYRDRLRQLHDRIVVDGAFVSHATRYLIEVTKPER